MAYSGSKPLQHAASKIKHPGATRNAAKRAGISTHEQAEKWSHEKGDTPKAKRDRARGNLALGYEHARH
jgi:hypothetical protein